MSPRLTPTAEAIARHLWKTFQHDPTLDIYVPVPRLAASICRTEQTTIKALCELRARRALLVGSGRTREEQRAGGRAVHHLDHWIWTMASDAPREGAP